MGISCRALVENTSYAPEIHSKHGLSLYVEACGRKILFDSGPDGTFLKNASALGIDISSVDIAVVSHGHNDHGGALKMFLEVNETASVHIRENAFDRHFSKIAGIPLPIGLDSSLKNNPRMVLTGEGRTEIAEGISVFSGVAGRRLFSSANANLMVAGPEGIVPDDFSHEQYMVVADGNHNVLFTGCSHNGILNILDRYYEIYGRETVLSTVIGGFHLYSPGSGRYEPEEKVEELAQLLMEEGPVFHTCHCTGAKAFDKMKAVMGDRLGYLSAGMSLELGL